MHNERKHKLVRYRSPAERRGHRRRRWRIAAVIVIAFAVLTVLDIPLAHILFNADRVHIQDSDLYRMLRVLGSFWTWLIVMWILRRHDREWDRAGSVFFAPLIAGLCSEGLKLVVARERPVEGDFLRPGWYSFNGLFSGFTEPNGGANLGFPSSHVAVAFAGLMVLAAWMPRARLILIALGIGTGLCRMLIGAHYATDVLAGALIGWWWARFFEPVALPRVYG